MDAETIVTLKEAGLESYLNDAYGWAYYEKVGKGAFIIGVGGGDGYVYVKANPDDPPEKAEKVGKSQVALASAGWSLGVQVITEVIFFEDKEAFDRFTTGTFEFEAGAKCAIITMGASSTAKTTGTSETITGPKGDVSVVKAGEYVNGMATFAGLKLGAMVDVSVAGQKFFYTPLEQ